MSNRFLTPPQHTFVNKIIKQMLPLFNTEDYCAVLWGSRAFGYDTDKSDFDINVIHSGKRAIRLQVTSEGEKYDMNFLSRRTFNQITHVVSRDLLQLIPLGQIVSSTLGPAMATFDDRQRSIEWKNCLLEEVKIDPQAAILPSLGQSPSGTLGLFLRQVYAYLIREDLTHRRALGLGGENHVAGPSIEVLAENIGGHLLVQDIQQVRHFRGSNVLSAEREDVIMKLFTRLVTRSTQPVP